MELKKTINKVAKTAGAVSVVPAIAKGLKFVGEKVVSGVKGYAKNAKLKAELQKEAWSKADVGNAGREAKVEEADRIFRELWKNRNN